jgi:hypothetical protein
MIGLKKDALTGQINIDQRALSKLQEHQYSDLGNVFFNTEEFSESIEYYHHGESTPETYVCNFDDPTQEKSYGSNSEITILKPQIMMPLHLMKRWPDTRDKLIVRGITYVIDIIESDGAGVAILQLQRQSSSAKKVG